MVEVEVLIRNIEATKVVESATQDTQVVFNVNASISEGARNPGEVVLRFNFELDTQPQVARFMVSGSATIKGEDHEIESLLALKDQEAVPAVFMRIYQRVYSVLYLVCGSLRIPYPSPGLLKSVNVSSTQNVAQAPGSVQNLGGLSV